MRAGRFLVAVSIICATGAAPARQPSGEGKLCAALARKAPPETLWVGTIIPGDDDEDPDDENRADLDEADTLKACFRSRRDCERWLYRMQDAERDASPRSGCAPVRSGPRRAPATTGGRWIY